MGVFLTTFVWLGLGIVIPLFWLKSAIGRQLTYEIGESTPTEGKVRRSCTIQKENRLLTVPHESVKTLYDVLQYAVKKYPASSHLFGQRDLVRIVEEEKQVTKIVNGVEKTETKTWKFFEMGPYKYLTYRDVADMATKIGAGLVKLGLKAQDKVNIFASTSQEWMLMTHGCYTQSIYITTAYDNLGVDALIFSLNEGEVSTIFTQTDLFDVIKKIGKNCPTLKTVIYKGTVGKKEQEIIDGASQFRFISLEELIQLGKENPVPPCPPKADDLCCIMYTSGSTGNPKGVMLTHGNMVASIAGVLPLLKTILAENEVYLAYLPLAHVLEFFIESTCIFCGVTLGYGSPKTLTDASVRNCKGDIRELRPTLMAGVPSVWETIRKGVQSKLKEASPVQQMVFNMAYALKKYLINLGLPHSFMDKIVFKKISDNTGGRLKFAVSGGAPMAAETHEFLTVTLCTLLQGYGMTESCGLIAVQNASDKGMFGVCGSPSPASEIKLVACNNYDPNPKDGRLPQGELWVRGANIMRGYYKQDKLTEEALTKDGWLMTGDIAEWRPDGSLAIIDRKKNLVKLAHGEYVALEKLESQYKTSKYFMNMCIHADPFQSYIIALIVPNEKELLSLKNDLGLGNVEHNHEKVLKEIQEDLLNICKTYGLKSAEILRTFKFVDDEWTPDNGFLTAAQKIKRKEILAHYKQEVEEMYGKK
ncbi:long-chain fatty acid-CoA ligase [Boothiomyces macroporosus]|uniref:Long-chain fatty acid-CoA ligase n=1 Tax=Boothiomyces macroporosus TaxID=261099 RepID=A0AAD5UEU2_9FUNG|nr:long-chain fatty acid-CoA ligase [Boothiomyces macroporosus]